MKKTTIRTFEKEISDKLEVHEICLDYLGGNPEDWESIETPDERVFLAHKTGVVIEGDFFEIKALQFESLVEQNDYIYNRC